MTSTSAAANLTATGECEVGAPDTDYCDSLCVGGTGTNTLGQSMTTCSDCPTS